MSYRRDQRSNTLLDRATEPRKPTFDQWYGEVIAHCIARDIEWEDFEQENFRED